LLDRVSASLLLMGSRGFFLRPSCQHACHPTDVQHRTDELELGANFVDTPEAELSEPQHLLDPCMRWLDHGFAPAVFGLSIGSVQLARQRRRERAFVRVESVSMAT
jgi:hypothetical protein